MSDFTITERTEPFALDEVFSFIDDTNISEMDACELKSRIADAVQGIRSKAIDEFADRMIAMMPGHKQDILKIAEQMKEETI